MFHQLMKRKGMLEQLFLASKVTQYKKTAAQIKRRELQLKRKKIRTSVKNLRNIFLTFF